MNNRIFTGSRKANDFIRDPRDEGEQYDAAHNAHPEIWPAEKGEDKDGDEHDDEKEIRAAARMQTGLRLHIGDGQRQILFIAMDGLMLCTMVLEDAANVLHPRNSPDIPEKDDKAQNTFHQIQKEGIFRHKVKKARRPRGNRNEDDRCKKKGKKDGAGKFLIRKLLFLLARHLCGIRKRTNAHDERFDERDGAAKHRLL